MNKFGERLKELRCELNISQQKIADDFKTTAATVSRWENSIQEPDIDTILKLSDYLKTTTDYLLGKTDY